MSAQSVRLNVTASNLANADNVTGNPATAYRARHPVFAAILNNALGDGFDAGGAVRVLDIVQSRAPAQGRHEPWQSPGGQQGLCVSVQCQRRRGDGEYDLGLAYLLQARVESVALGTEGLVINLTGLGAVSLADIEQIL